MSGRIGIRARSNQPKVGGSGGTESVERMWAHYFRSQYSENRYQGSVNNTEGGGLREAISHYQSSLGNPALLLTLHNSFVSHFSSENIDRNITPYGSHVR